MVRRANNTFKKIKTLGDAQLNSSLGGTHQVGLPESRYTSELRFTVNVGTLDTGSWNADAEVDIFDAIKLVANNEVWEIDGQLTEYVNVYTQGVGVNKQLVVDLRIPHKGKATGMVRGADFSSLYVELDLDQIGDISGGTSQSGTEIIVSGRQHQSGSTDALLRISDSVEQLPNGDFNFELRQSGQLSRVIFEEEGATLSDLEVTVVRTDGEFEVIDDPVSTVRRRNVKSAGTTALPAGYYLVDFSDLVDFGEESVRYVEVSGKTSASGNVRSHVFSVDTNV